MKSASTWLTSLPGRSRAASSRTPRPARPADRAAAGDFIPDDGLARCLKALACTAPLHDLDARKVRLDWAAAVYQMAEVAFQILDQSPSSWTSTMGPTTTR